MTRKTYRKCKFCGDFHDVDNWPDNHREWVPDNRSELASPSVINGSVDYEKGRSLAPIASGLGFVMPAGTKKTHQKNSTRRDCEGSVARSPGNSVGLICHTQGAFCTRAAVYRCGQLFRGGL